jgi:hypothetical protein
MSTSSIIIISLLMVSACGITILSIHENQTTSHTTDYVNKDATNDLFRGVNFFFKFQMLCHLASQEGFRIRWEIGF